jgi:hypothetical protein
MNNKQTNSTDTSAVGQPPVGDRPAAPAPMAPTPGSEADLAIALIRLLMWPNPNGKIKDYYIPGWLRESCVQAINRVPVSSLREAQKRCNLTGDLVKMYLKDHPQNTQGQSVGA